jgi:FMN phosphatase YigB (HAD superfamily)
MPNIRNLIFDLGGVVLNLEIPRTERAFERLAASPEAHRAISEALQREAFFERFEIGEFSGQVFLDTLRAHNPAATEEQLRKAWSAMLLDLPAERVDLLRRLGTQFRIFLFSNTNELHVADFREIVRAAHGPLDFDGLFEQAWYSHLIGCRKPHAEAFRHVLGLAGLRAEETLFVDDNPPNIAGATSVGIHAHLHAANSDLEVSLRSFGLDFS